MQQAHRISSSQAARPAGLGSATDGRLDGRGGPVRGALDRRARRARRTRNGRARRSARCSTPRHLSDLGLPPFSPRRNGTSSESPAGTLRGFHAEPWEKFVHVVHGEAFAAIVDLRPDSPTAGAVWTGTLDRTRALFLTRGLGNAFQVLSDDAIYAYLVNGALARGRQPTRRCVERPRTGRRRGRSPTNGSPSRRKDRREPDARRAPRACGGLRSPRQGTRHAPSASASAGS